MKSIVIAAGLSLMLAFGAIGCRDEGPAEKAGRQIDEAVEDVRAEGEGALERMGREIDEAVEETEEAAEEIQDAVEGDE